ncbi:MAG: Signal transduction histidine kinase CheA / CheY-like domain [uncultured Sphingomonas sp.]|uniref:Chemotaxis protein CheA n=1 Tax=uncultured Sphingomonas sp. TaxID=158754 RepID=A0A6J4ST88_9SPHN|nr:chemotaxis protein CheA [uncultured Sphingomonas sp.]CAA9504675.1 MAG: Signal transduction histidine kinase CheA / CheY-like domain [uncultured Sphingomonas sp.]
MDDLIADFVAECREMLESLGGEIVAWEAQPEDRSRLDSIFRFVHTVKGNCGFFEFPRLEALSHAAEDALADVRAGRRQADGALVSAVLAVIDRIGEMVEVIAAGESLPEGDDAKLIQGLAPGADGSVAVPAAAVVGEVKNASVAPRTIRLSVELLDRVMSGVSDMVLARNELARRLRDNAADVAVDGAFERLSGIIAEMRDAITRTRMQRIENLFVSLPRMVRDLSAELGKQVLVDVEGGDVELDREMIEMIRDPLTHIVRNAVDHGIEGPAERLKAGKREIGFLSVSARQSGNQILIDICDDGRGIDGKRLVEKAVAAGLIEAADAVRLSPAQQFELMFEAGLSTAAQVTNISGRGVGMDVVRSNIERIGGVVEVDSRLGVGSRMTLRVPLTLTIIPALTVSIGSQHFAIPRSAIEEIVRANGDSVTLSQLGGAGVATIRGRRVPEVALADILELPSSLSDEQRTLVVLRPGGGDVFALAVDKVHDHEELVVKPAAPAVMATGLYAGTTLADDGSPILLFDPAGLARVGGVKLEGQERVGRALETAPVTSERVSVPVLLFRTLDGARRAVRLATVDRIEDVSAAAVQWAAGQLRVQLGEAILPLGGCDARPAHGEKLRMFRLSDGCTEMGLAFKEVIDMAEIVGEIVPAEVPGEVAGVTLIGGEPAELVDVHWLFARHCGTAGQGKREAVCRLPTDDAWMQNMLRPIVEAAGYRVVGTDSEEPADLVIAAEGSADPAGEKVPTIRLRSDPEAPTNDGSIYRYDRAGLMTALKAVGGGVR